MPEPRQAARRAAAKPSCTRLALAQQKPASWLSKVGAVEPPLVYSDSSSALTLVGRKGQGRLKHVEIRLLAIQDWKEEGRLRLGKVATLDNLSDLLTKHVTRSTMELLRPRLGLGENHGV